MQDLSGGQYPANLVPSSMEGGNTTAPQTAAAAAMTAPGSQPVTPMPAPADQSVLPQPQLGEVYQAPNREHGDPGGTQFADTWTGTGKDWPA